VRSVRWLCVLSVVAALSAGVPARQSAQSEDIPPQPPEVVASNWAGQNIRQTLDDLLPMKHPDPAYAEDQDFITFRYTHWILTASREYSFSLIRRSYERPGPLVFYWLAIVRMPQSAPILGQLEQLRIENPAASLAALEQKIKMRTWALDEKNCPAIRTQAETFLRLRFKPPFNRDSVVLDAPSFEFQVSSGETSMSAFLGTDDRTQPLIPWALDTRRILGQCGAPETAASKEDQ
jgi:hypothetical protein